MTLPDNFALGALVGAVLALLFIIGLGIWFSAGDDDEF